MRRGRSVPLALAAGLALAAVANGGENPHAALAKRAACLSCHVEVPRKGSVRRPLRFRQDVVTLCLNCHREKDLSTLHPVDVRAGSRVPGDLPLDEHGAVTCATCHDPHARYEASRPYVAESLSTRLLSVVTRRQKYRTFYLRRQNDAGQLCLGCHQKALLAAEGFHVKEASILDQYVGSDSCGTCHAREHAQWKRTPHARMTRDARRDPGSVLGDFSKDPPFPREQIVYALGSHFTQRYVIEREGRLVAKAATWSIWQGAWETRTGIDKPWAQYCQGCHTTGFEMKEAPRYSELGIGCEACHGPGRAHVQARGKGAIVNPARLDPEERAMICEACHTSGHDRSAQFRFPLGYLPGRDLTRYYKGLLPRPGQDNATFVGDESYSDRHRQWGFWTESLLDVREATCGTCNNFRDKAAAPRAKTKMSISQWCQTCHRAGWPRSAVHQQHEKQAQCTDCHGAQVARGQKGYSVHDHKFVFGTPRPVRPASPLDACRRCHPKMSFAQARNEARRPGR